MGKKAFWNDGNNSLIQNEYCGSLSAVGKFREARTDKTEVDTD